MNAIQNLALAGARAHRSSLTGTLLVLTLASGLLSATGVLVESGIRSAAGNADGVAAGGGLSLLASSFAGTAIVIVALVVSATLTLALRQRRHEFALLGAIGATRPQVRALIRNEVAVVTLVAVALGSVPGLLLPRLLVPLLVDAGVVAADFEPTLTPLPILAAALFLVPTALMGARLAARETLRAPTTTALRESTVEPREVGRVRRVSAVVLAVAGLAVAFTPLFVPGTIGAATAASSSYLLLGAAALAGPLLIQWTFAHTARLRGRRPSARLASANIQGFARRLTAVVIPLALAVSLGTVQSGVDRAVSTAASEQYGDSVRADEVVTSASPLSADQVSRLSALDGVARTAPMATVAARVRTDSEDIAMLEGLSWEATQLLVLPADVAPQLFDPGVVDGSLSGLETPDTVAVSTDLAFEIGVGVGDSITLRFDEDGDQRVKVVAEYDRGLGIGDFIVGPETIDAQGVEAPASAALLGLDPATGTDAAATREAVAAGVASMGLQLVGHEEFVRAATTPQAAGQRLSLVVTMLLLLFVGLGAANALVLTTRGRREELRLLQRIGATRRQLVAMATRESFVTGGAAWLIGSLVAAPGVLGVSFGLLGAGLPPVSLAMYATLSAGVLLVSTAAMVLTVMVNLHQDRA